LSGLFITGTDTGVGKTLVSATIIHKLVSKGLKVAAMKPVATGCAWRAGALHSEDMDILAGESNVRAPFDWTMPYAFEPAVAPHIAARQQKTYISISHILDCYSRLSDMADIVVVEGVGGFRVPLNELQDTADLAVLLGLPMVLVVGLRLGCLNHALLTAEVMKQRGLKLAGWVANRIDPSMAQMESNIKALDEWLRAPKLGVLPLMVPPEAVQASPFLEVNSVIKNTIK
jgi:dethiobiotin synthetase